MSTSHKPESAIVPSSLSRKLAAYSVSPAYPFHMPGHKRNPEFMSLPPINSIDITEIDGFDNLHHAEGILREACRRAARVRGADRTWFLVNGSSGGLLAAIAACTQRGGRVLVARNCHKSVYNAIELCGLHPVYVYPRLHPRYGIYEGIDRADIAALLKKYKDIQAVVITSPTYEGVVSDIRGIGRAVHSYHIPLIVDSAHGAHLGYSGAFPESAVALGADIIIESLHKTLPSMTQTALLHRCGSRVDDERLQKYLAMYQTSSPSYVMMASMDQCMALLETKSGPLFEAYEHRLLALRQALTEEGEGAAKGKGSNTCGDEDEADSGSRPFIRLLGAGDLCQAPGSSYDNSKLVLYVEGRRGLGRWLYDCLREDYELQMEMASADYVLAMTSICDTDEGFERLFKAVKALNVRLLELPKEPREAERRNPFELLEFVEVPPMCSDEASRLPVEWVERSKACGRLCGTYLYLYPPGVPFGVPGERITPKMLELIESYESAGLEIIGLDAGAHGAGEPGGCLKVLKNPEE